MGDEELERYLEEAARQPLLSRARESELARAAAAGDDDAKGELVRCNLRLVVALARRYRAAGMPLLDLIQEGNLGLMRAADSFDPASGFAFSSSATWTIRRALGEAIHAVESDSTLSRLQDAWDAFVVRAGRQPTMAELATETGLAEEEILDLLGLPPS